MKRGQVFVRARNKEGAWDSVDVLDLDDDSFRAFVLEMLVRRGMVTAIRDVESESIELRERK